MLYREAVDGTLWQFVIMGQDIAYRIWWYKITDGFVAQFGKERVINTLFARAR
jgi:pyruvate/2-oxoglutarate/acetoin dehydrogenase E1 component